jgi:AraC-like DNA-binding protein
VGRALQVIGENLNSDVSLTAVAAAAHLSPSRLSHLFSSEIGIPLRRYVLWRRLIRAASAVQNGASWTEAAHAGGFSDSSHMNRTFRRMFGLAPTDVHRDVEWTTAATEPASLAH